MTDNDRSEAGRRLISFRKWEKQTLTCPVCGEPFESNGSRARYCSSLCRWKAWKKRQGEKENND